MKFEYLNVISTRNEEKSCTLCKPLYFLYKISHYRSNDILLLIGYSSQVDVDHFINRFSPPQNIFTFSRNKSILY